jgi:hypothetical protein
MANGAAAPKKAGKVVFKGGNRLLAKQQQGAADPAKPAAPKPKPEEPKEEEPKFSAFTGKPRTLRG